MSEPLATNRKALRDFEVLESVECGIELRGGEVKSLRAKKVNLNDSYARIEKGQVLLYHAHISPYMQASYMNEDPVRPRKLLLHKGQILKLAGRVAQKGFTLVPLKVYFNDRGFAKLELALCKGKKLYDRRQDVRARDVDRYMRRMGKR
jgi:SsrA-binding protein